VDVAGAELAAAEPLPPLDPAQAASATASPPAMAAATSRRQLQLPDMADLLMMT
jgi:hypothetical protein